MVNKAGTAGVAAAIEEPSAEELDCVYRINLRSGFLFCQKVVPIMRNQGRGRIVNIASPRCSFTTGVVFDLSGGRATY